MSLQYSYSPNYFSITDILATEERISCTVEVPLPRLGFLDAGSNSEDLKEGTKIELPVWLAYSLNTTTTPIVSVDIPKYYKDCYREILHASAHAVTLSRWNPFYYELGMHLRKFNSRDCETVTEGLLYVFKARCRLIMDWAQNPTTDPTTENRLPRLEENLYEAGRKAKLKLNAWLNKGTGNIETSEVVTNLRKRKRTDYELD